MRDRHSSGRPDKGRPKAFHLFVAIEAAVVAAAGLFVLVGIPYHPTQALFTDTQGVGANAFTAKPDWLAPATGASKLLNSLGYTDLLKQGDTYRACATVAEDGNPPSGISTVSANVAVASNVITTAQTAASLSAGAFTCDGVAYNFQSAVLTADASITQGAKTFQVTAADVAANSATTSWSVTIDNTAPTVSSFSTQNVSGGTAGNIENGDTATVVVSETNIDLNRILAGWDGSSTPVFVKLLNNGFGPNKDGLWVCIANTANCAAGTSADEVLGNINLKQKDYVTATVVFDATMAWSAGTNTFTVTVGSCVSGCTSVSTGSGSIATCAPIAGSSQGGLRDKAGNNTSASSTATENAVHF